MRQKTIWNAALTNTTTTSDCQTPSGQILDQPEQEMGGYRGKDFEKKKLLRRLY